MRVMIDKALLLALGAMLAASARPSGVWTGVDAMFVTGLLAAVCASSLSEWRMGRRGAWAVACLMTVAAVACPRWVAFMPPIAYDAARVDVPRTLREPLRTVLRWMWVVPVLRTLADVPWGSRDAAWAVTIALAVCAGFAFGGRSSQATRWHAALLAAGDRARDSARANRVRLADEAEERARSVRMATLGERTRIAREIHDNVGHLLTRAIMQVQAGRAVADATGDAVAANGFAGVAATLDDAMTMVRRSVHDLEDDGTDFAARIADAVGSFDGAAPGFRVALANDVVSAPAPVARGFATIIREALTNVVRHSDADGASVTLRDFPAFWQLVIRDPGPAKADAVRRAGAGADPPRGMGLADIEARARQLGGNALCGPYDGGWRVFVSVPKKRWITDATKGRKS